MQFHAQTHPEASHLLKKRVRAWTGGCTIKSVLVGRDADYVGLRCWLCDGEG